MKTLTVAELIEKLKEMPPHLVVKFETDDGNSQCIMEDIVSVKVSADSTGNQFVEVVGDE